MKNKVRNALDWYYQRLVNEPCKETYNDFNDQYKELVDLIYRMWKVDLISDRVKDECFEVLTEYGHKTIKYTF